MRRLLLAPVLVALAGAASDPLAGRVAGPPSDCIALRSDEGAIVAGPHTLLYRESGRRVWRTGPAGQCAAFEQPATIVADVFAGQLCRGDLFRSIGRTNIAPSAPCRFDRFIPYDLPPRR